MNTPSENAVQFVNLLVPGGFKEAMKWLSVECTYEYAGKTLVGPEIIKSFEDNHSQAKEIFTTIEYLDGFADRVEDNTVWVVVKDKLTIGDREHVYKDCLVITCNEMSGHGSILKIANQPFLEERRKLQEFKELK